MKDAFLNFANMIFTVLKNIMQKYLVADADVSREIFICLTGLMSSVIIFIAGTIIEEKNEAKKGTILCKSRIKQEMLFCIIILIGILIFSSITSYCEEIGSQLEHNYLAKPNEICLLENYKVFRIVINILTIIFAYGTFKTFAVTIKLIKDKDYLNKEIDKYIRVRSCKIEQKANKSSLKNLKKYKNEFKCYLENHKQEFDCIHNIEKKFSKESYKPLVASKAGIIKEYNYKKLSYIVDEIKNNFEIDDKNPILVFEKDIGDKVEKGNTVCYCLNQLFNYFEDFPNYIIYDENSKYIADEIKSIQKSLFQKAMQFKEPQNFDDDARLLNYCDYLYKNNLNGVKSFYLSQISETKNYIWKNEYKNAKYTYFLSLVLSLAYKYENLEDYQEISQIILNMYIIRLEITTDAKQVAYDFANKYFRYDYSLTLKNSEYYDVLMSNLLNYMIINIRRKKFEEIDVLFKNMQLKKMTSYDCSNQSKHRVLNLQFASSIVKCLVILLEKNDDFNNYIEEIKKILIFVKAYFINTDDAWTIINDFEKCYRTYSSIQRIYNDLDLRLKDKDYTYYKIAWVMKDEKVLRELLCSFNIKDTDFINLDGTKITDLERANYNSFLKFISAPKTIYENKMKIDFSDNHLSKILSLAIKSENDDSKNNGLKNL